jgi:hypothetical protein
MHTISFVESSTHASTKIIIIHNTIFPRSILNEAATKIALSKLGIGKFGVIADIDVRVDDRVMTVRVDADVVVVVIGVYVDLEVSEDGVDVGIVVRLV